MEGPGSTVSSPPSGGSSHNASPDRQENSGRFSCRDATGTSASLTASVSQQRPSQAGSSPDQGGAAAEPGLSAPSVPKRDRPVGSYVITALRIAGVIVATPFIILGAAIAASVTLACFMSEYQCLENTTTPRNNICAALKGLGAGVLGIAGGLVVGPGVALCSEYLFIRNIIAGRQACYTEDTEDDDPSSDAPADEASCRQGGAVAPGDLPPEDENLRGAVAIMRRLVQDYCRQRNPFAAPMDALPVRRAKRG